ncbi:winged helix-turn-helix domain-containing protein [Parabacteroides sp. FAFU027]|uniref:winged helix-turn-helix domain-containing protein n=1 Tax=Parabacteroides sp. FAFU027 TaxID=2922715 RepID=UPI001FAEE469|nr:transcriptional regulator [Parabacteroides sp. FAFU027]
MKNPIEKLNKAFESKVRLGIMSTLMVNESVDFNSLKSWLNLTDGNLSSHIKGLEELGYIEVRKQFVGKKPNTTYHITDAGKIAFEEHINGLEALLKSMG